MSQPYTSRSVFSLLIVSMMLMLAACGGGNDESSTIPLPEPEIERPIPDPGPDPGPDPEPDPEPEPEPEPEPTSQVLPLPEGAWVTYYESGPFTIQPGAFYSRGLVILGCPAGGAACTITVEADQVATYDSAGGVPFVAATMPEEPLDYPGKIGSGDVPYKRIGDLPVVATHDDVEVRYGTAEEGVGRDYLAAYLLDESRDNPELGKVDRFDDTPPTVRVVQGATADMIADTAMIVREINSHLPSTWQLQFSNVPAPSIDEHREGEILIAFPSKEDWQWEGAQGRASTRKGFASTDTSIHPITGARVWVKGSHWTTEVAGVDLRRLGRLYLAHEMLHALGRHHPSITGQFFNKTVLGNPFTATSENEPGSFLAPLDKEALLAIYTKFNPTDNAAEAAEILGDDWMRSVHLWGYVGLRVWTDVIERHGGGIEYLDFGMSLEDGEVNPWVVSRMAPWTNLADNPALSGSASWNGVLLGLTPAVEVVSGKASMNIDLLDLTGALDFTSLESWGSDQLPGQIGGGTVWGDGSLNYDVSVTGNTFVRVDNMNGDEGEITGAFYGTQHEAFGGILERDDLSAAFGGLQDTACFVDSGRASVMPCN